MYYCYPCVHVIQHACVQHTLCKIFLGRLFFPAGSKVVYVFARRQCQGGLVGGFHKQIAIGCQAGTEVGYSGSLSSSSVSTGCFTTVALLKHSINEGTPLGCAETIGIL